MFLGFLVLFVAEGNVETTGVEDVRVLEKIEAEMRRVPHLQLGTVEHKVNAAVSFYFMERDENRELQKRLKEVEELAAKMSEVKGELEWM